MDARVRLHDGSEADHRHRELLRTILRQTLHDNGIPLDWIRGEALVATAPGRTPGLHMRFLLLHWNANFMTYLPAFQRTFKKTLLAMDPTARDWLMGFSWQFGFAFGAGSPDLPAAVPWEAGQAAP